MVIKVDLSKIDGFDGITHNSEVSIETSLSFTVINAMFHPKVSHYIKDGFLFIDFPKDKLQLHLHGQKDNGFNLVYHIVNNRNNRHTNLQFNRYDEDFKADGKTKFVLIIDNCKVSMEIYDKLIINPPKEKFVAYPSSAE